MSPEELTSFLDEFNHIIFEMVSSNDVNEKKGGILAIGSFNFMKHKSWIFLVYSVLINITFQFALLEPMLETQITVLVDLLYTYVIYCLRAMLVLWNLLLKLLVK